ncbi:hypothetical protein RVIR1_10220 [Candidatus Rickettsiella viridis]|uniref:Uncharacterized protein n=1 Tax=Candidatus Rickettsiella viridis TaxID=676208 RepID=A0A2Z5UVK6_9COXI|nr:hypothetical protein [Candidatus Rickettsiella viridis]BBB15494.1 hypothetical protein RVIR1_10220 [Candidatus Rickettsiella viridis]
MAISEQDKQNKEEKEYLFDGCYAKQLQSVLQKRSLVFDIYYLGTRKAQRVEVKSAVSINKSLLPIHCNLNLIEDALASLEKYPEDIQLLNALGEYTKNKLAERIGYWSMGGGTNGSYFIPFPFLHVSFFILSTIVAAIFPITLPFIVAALILFGLNTYHNGSIGMKIGRWVGNLLKGTHQKSANLKECENNLKACIDKYKMAGQPKTSSMLAPQVSNRYQSFEELMAEKMLSTRVSEKVDVKSSYDPFFQSADKAEGSVSSTHDSLLESTEDTHILSR